MARELPFILQVSTLQCSSLTRRRLEAYPLAVVDMDWGEYKV